MKIKFTLPDLENAIRPQFVWETDEPWKTSRKVEGGKEVGMIVYIGLASMHGFDKDEISGRLGIANEKFEKFYARYKKYLNAAIANDFSSLLSAERAFSSKLISRTNLAQSYLMHKHKAPRINFADHL